LSSCVASRTRTCCTYITEELHTCCTTYIRCGGCSKGWCGRTEYCCIASWPPITGGVLSMTVIV
jgi:hypothetical protein